jgi:hypothetical protein
MTVRSIGRSASAVTSDPLETDQHQAGAPPPGILVGEFDEPRHDATPALDGVDRPAACEHLSSPSIDHRVEDRFVGSKQRDVIQTQNLWNETGKVISHAVGRPQRPQRSIPCSLADRRRLRQRCTPIALRHRPIRHSDVWMAVGGEGGWVADRRLPGRPSGARSRFHLTTESFIK